MAHNVFQAERNQHSAKPDDEHIRRADPESRKQMRRKLRKFKGLLDEGKMTRRDVYAAYQSWRGNYRKRFDAFHTIRRMDALYTALFINNHPTEEKHECLPGKEKRNGHLPHGFGRHETA
jgi:hypothetical protein